ncbi:MAG: DUF5050 domain-containing protein [Lachnospiraceae bacterium]
MNLKKIGAVLIPITICVVFVVLYYFNTRIIENPVGTIGNSAGNLYNDGLFAEYNGKVYFSNPYDYHSLYSMNADETDIKKLTNIASKYICASEHNLYFYQESSISGAAGLGFIRSSNGIYRSNLSGKNTECLVFSTIFSMQLIDNTIFFDKYNAEDGSASFNSVKINEKKDQELLQKQVAPSCVNNSAIYYTNINEDLTLYQYDTLTGVDSMFYSHKMWQPIIDNGYLYYMDLESNYQLHRLNLSTFETTVLTTDRVDLYNVYGSYIYYQRNSEDPALMRMAIDGSNPEVVKYGNFHNLNITSHYVYFNNFNTSAPLYHQSTFGPISVEEFHPY